MPEAEEASGMTAMADGAAAGVSGYDPLDPQVLSDPAGAHRYLREHCPVHHYTGFDEKGFYSVARHDDVRGVFTDVDLWSSDWGQGPIYSKEGGLRSDPPEHTVYRKLATSAFSARRVNAMAPTIRRVTQDLVTAAAPAGRADLITAVAVPLPMTMISLFLGVPTGEQDRFKAWSNEFMSAQNASDAAVQASARHKIDTYFGAELDRRRTAREGGATLPDDILTALLEASNELHGGRPFTTAELQPLIVLLLVGGNETTTSLIGNLVWRLLQLGLWQQVVDHPELRDAAVDESLRHDPPVLGLFRTNTRPTSLGGVELPAGSKVHGLYASANRDPAVWEDPDTFRLDRPLDDLRRRHLSFGLGQYLCPGAMLARMEARFVLDALAEQLPGLRLVREPERTDSFMMWGPKSLPVAWDV